MFTATALLVNVLVKSKSVTATMALKNVDKPLVLFVLGKPGAGKGTQCLNITRDYPFEHLSAGDLLRAERNSGSKDGDLIQSYIKEGNIVPVEITVRLLEKAMNESTNNRFLIDGFPRNENNLQGWQNYMKDKADVRGVLLFDCPDDVCVKRILERGKTSGRVDDNEESLRKRFRTFYNDTQPVLNFYAEKNLVMSVNAIPDPEEVYQSVKLIIDKL